MRPLPTARTHDAGQWVIVAMSSNEAAQPPTTQGDNGEAMPAGETPEPVQQAREQADQIRQHGRPSGTGNPPTGKERQREPDSPSN